MLLTVSDGILPRIIIIKVLDLSIEELNLW